MCLGKSTAACSARHRAHASLVACASALIGASRARRLRQRLLAGIPGKAWRHDILRTLRMTYRFGVANKLVDKNPTLAVKTSQPVRGENILPLSIEEVDRVASEAGRLGRDDHLHGR
jgi:hypothetical protein